MDKIHRIVYTGVGIFLLVLFIISSLWCGGAGVSYAAAAADVQSAFESRNVLDDLDGSTIGGKEFSLNAFGWDKSKNTQVISFVEYCYSYYSTEIDDYALYVYVYNPQCVDYVYDSVLNEITIACAKDKDDKTVNYYPYSLTYLNMSMKAGYEGLFFKYKVELNATEKERILSSVKAASRVYKIGEIELLVNGETNAQGYAVGSSYIYSGYAEGYGNNYATSDTLSCTVDNFSEVLSLDVHSTYYRPEGSNGSADTQDTLHSVYFSVPNAIIDEYGEMTAVHATWLNAYTTPIFVTGNKDYYDVFTALIGKESPETDYAFRTNESGRYFGGVYFVNYSHGYNYSDVDTELSTLNYVFYAGKGDNFADNYTLPAEKILDWFSKYTSNFGGELVNGKYSSALFEQVDTAVTDKTIYSTDEYKLTSVISSQNLWQKIWGLSTSYKNEYNISAIQEVTLSDMDNASSETEFCNSYYVAESDYSEFYSYVKTAEANDETVYLFRYFQSDYFSVELSEGQWKEGWHTQSTIEGSLPVYGNYYSQQDTNAYLCQMWVQLDFDIIDLTFTKDNVSTVIPVAMSPMDIAADATPPIIVTSDGGLEWWKIVLAVLALILLLVLLAPILPYIVQAVLWIILLPVKLIKAIIKAFKKRE